MQNSDGFDLNTFLASYGGMPGPSFDQAAAIGGVSTSTTQQTTIDPSSTSILSRAGYTSYSVAPSQSQRPTYRGSQPLEGQGEFIWKTSLAEPRVSDPELSYDQFRVQRDHRGLLTLRMDRAVKQQYQTEEEEEPEETR